MYCRMCVGGHEVRPTRVRHMGSKTISCVHGTLGGLSRSVSEFHEHQTRASARDGRNRKMSDKDAQSEEGAHFIMVIFLMHVDACSALRSRLDSHVETPCRVTPVATKRGRTLRFYNPRKQLLEPFLSSSSEEVDPTNTIVASKSLLPGQGTA